MHIPRFRNCRSNFSISLTARVVHGSCSHRIARYSVGRCSRRRVPKQDRQSIVAAAASVATPVVAVIPATTWLVSIGVFAVCCTLVAFLVTAIFLLRRLMRTLQTVDTFLGEAKEEMPGVAAAVRLTGLELSDCILEFSLLSKELTGGIKASARTIQAAEQAAREGGSILGGFVREKVVPGVATRIKASAAIVDYLLKGHQEMADAALDQQLDVEFQEGSVPASAQLAASVKDTLRQLRAALAAGTVLAELLARSGALIESSREQQLGEAAQQQAARPVAEA